MATNKQEYEARVHFLRIFDTFCTQKGLMWSLHGDFIRRFLSDADTSTTTMTFSVKLFPTRMLVDLPSRLNQVVKMMEMIGLIRNKTQIIDGTILCDVEIMNDNKSTYKFPVFIYTGIENESTFSCDTVALSSSGLLVTRHPTIDYFNNSVGVALLERMFQLKLKNVQPLQTYFNEPNASIDRLSRFTNASIMFKENMLAKEGFTFNGPHLCRTFSPEKTCPVCFESPESRPTTFLRCSHPICFECLSKHMERRGSNHAKCPICRRAIELSIVT